MQSAQHYHRLSRCRAAHPTLRRPDTATGNKLYDLAAAHVVARTISAVLQQNGQRGTLIFKGVYNAPHRIRIFVLNGRTPIQAIIEQVVAFAFSARCLFLAAVADCHPMTVWDTRTGILEPCFGFKPPRWLNKTGLPAEYEDYNRQAIDFERDSLGSLGEVADC